MVFGPHGWKHGVVNRTLLRNSPSAPQTLFLVLVKNPYAWLASLHREPYHAHGHQGLPMGEFLRKEWRSWANTGPLLRMPGRGGVSELQGDLKPDGTAFENVCRLRTYKLKEHLSLLKDAPYARLVRSVAPPSPSISP